MVCAALPPAVGVAPGLGSGSVYSVAQVDEVGAPCSMFFSFKRKNSTLKVQFEFVPVSSLTAY